MPDLNQQIDNVLQDGGEVVLIGYSLLEETENHIKHVLRNALIVHEKEDLLDPIFSSIKELTTNAIKANIKQVLIEEGIISDPDDPMIVVQGIKSVLNEKSLRNYGRKCRDRHLSTRIYMQVDNESFTIRVVNPLPINQELNERIQEKINLAAGYDSLAEFYINNPDPYAEGMGIGLSMVVILLKGIGVDYRNFTVGTDTTSRTFANLTIPFNQLTLVE